MLKQLSIETYGPEQSNGNILESLTLQGPNLKHLSVLVSFAHISLLILTFISVSFAGEAALAQSAGNSTDQQVVDELQKLAKNDVDNDIARRTEFIVQLYEGNSTGLTSLEVRQIYDDAYSERAALNQLRQNQYLALGLLLGLLALGIAAYVISKKKFLKVKRVSANIPFGIGQLELETVETSRRAAWALYVELSTRIATQQLEDEHGLLREALNSLYSLFGITRQILKEAGPDVGASPETVGGIATAVLNQGLRPFLAEWHPKLQSWEAKRPEGMSTKEHEKNWSEEAVMRRALKDLVKNLEQYTNSLAKIAGAKL
jgi:hypothetical protein